MDLCVRYTRIVKFTVCTSRVESFLTVFSFNSLAVPGTRLHGSNPQPANRPPGVWNNRKLSASPTLVTCPKRLRFLQNSGSMLIAWGMRFR